MPDPIPLDFGHQVWELRACWEASNGVLASSGWHFLTAHAIGVTQAELLSQWRAACEFAYTFRRPEGFRVSRYVVVDVWPSVQADLVVDIPFPGPPFEGSGESTPPQVSGLITWRTGIPGRSFRGRTFWGPLREEDVLFGQTWPPDANGIARTFVFNLMTAFAGPTSSVLAAFVILSRRHDGVQLDPPVVSYVNQASVDQTLRTIRRRNHWPANYLNAWP